MQAMNDQLRVTGNIAALTEEDKEKIRENKAGIISFLKDNSAYKKEFSRIKPAPAAESAPLSSSQRRIWLLSQFEDGSAAYNMAEAYLFEGGLDKGVLENALTALIERHEILRTVFRETQPGEIRQFVLPAVALPFRIAYHDMRGAANADEEVSRQVKQDAGTVFDLAGGPLLRAGLYQIKDNGWVFSFVMHHIISDGWSMDILVQELLTLYNSSIAGQPDSLTPLRIQYKDYAVWLQAQLKSGLAADHKAYWVKQFEGALPVLSLQPDKPRPAFKTYNGGEAYAVIGRDITKGLKALLEQQGATLFMGLLAGMNAVLYRYTSQEDIIIGSPVAGREHIDLENQVGLYANTLALRTRFSGQESYLKLLEQVKEVTLSAYKHQIYPFDELLNDLRLQRDVSRNPLFDIQVIVQSKAFRKAEERELGAVKISSYNGGRQGTGIFDFVFNFTEIDEELHVNIDYNSDIYSSRTLLQLCTHLEKLLQSVITDPGLPVSKLEFLTEKDKQTLLVDFNNRKATYPCSTFVELFENQVKQSPDSIALVYENTRLTYRQLDDYANRLAGYIKHSYQVKPGQLIGIMLERTEKLIIAILGVLKAGAAYVPLDPDYPVSRKEFILKETEAAALIAQANYILDLDYYNGPVFAIDAQLGDLESDLNPGPAVIRPADLAYVLYTSGSTGMPKGVMVTHGGALNTIYALKDIYESQPGERHLQFASPCFDVSVSETFVAFASGATLYMIGDNVKIRPDLLEQFIIQHQVDMATIPPAYLKVLDVEKLSSLKKLVTGGEAAIPEKVAEFTAYGDFFNGYGLTETSIGATTYKIARNSRTDGTTIPLGLPFPNSQVYILDDQLQLVAPGAVGEMYIGGAGISGGYLGNPALTNERFVPNPFNKEERLHKTGDLARWLPDGNLEFIGRKDEQIKIRSFRVEPGEIESLLRNHPDVTEAVVVATTDPQGDKLLAAYLTSEAPLDITRIKTYLGANLPAYMVPQQFVQLETLPLTLSGKVDKKALPELSGNVVHTKAPYVAPSNEVEEKLVLIWEEVLGREKISVQDNFFELGGHSLKAIKILAQMHREFHVKVSLEDLFSHPTIEDIGKDVSRMLWARQTPQEDTAGVLPDKVNIV